MEHTLRCNNLKCHRELNDHAVVTTCSHIFCIDCSNKSQLSGQSQGHRPICLACEMHLPNPDDVVVTNLNPTEDYKTSVLSGLSPHVIIECANRALRFWAYQATQEIVYQEYLAKNLTDKYSTLSTQMDKVIHDANGEISNLRNKISTMHLEQDSLRRKNEELVQAFREKSRKLIQTQEFYDKFKQRVMLGQVQNAASDAVDHTIQASATATQFVEGPGNQNQPRPEASPYSNLQINSEHHSVRDLNGGSNIAAPKVFQGWNRETWAGFGRPESANAVQSVQATPSTHRQRLASGGNVASVQVPSPRIALVNLHNNNITETPAPQRRVTPGRPPLTSLNANSNNMNTSSFAGYGMSAGLKVSNPTRIDNGFARPIIRSRVAQRPSPRILPNGTSADMFSNGGGCY